MVAVRKSARQQLKARILLKADASDAGEGWSDSQIAAALCLVSVNEIIDTETGQSLSASTGNVDVAAGPPAVPLNRHERRAMERAARKGRAA